MFQKLSLQTHIWSWFLSRLINLTPLALLTPKITTTMAHPASKQTTLACIFCITSKRPLLFSLISFTSSFPSMEVRRIKTLAYEKRAFEGCSNTPNGLSDQTSSRTLQDFPPRIWAKLSCKICLVKSTEPLERTPVTYALKFT